MSPDAPPDSGPTPWYRRLRLWLVGAAGVVLVGVVGNAVSDSVHDYRHRTPAPSAEVSIKNATTTLPPSSSSSTSTAISTKVAYAGPPGSGWSVDGKPTEVAGDLLTLTASMDPSDSCHGGAGWVFGQRPAAVAPLPFASDANQWAVRNGGAPASGNFVTVDVQARPGHPVIIDSIGYRVVARATPLRGSYPSLSGGCGGLVPSFFAADVDRGTSVRAVPGQDESGKTVRPVPLPHRLDDADPSEQWRIQLVSTTCLCDVVPSFRYTSGGLTATVDITNRGGAWRVDPTKGAALLSRSDEAGRWTAYGTAR